ncbi:Lysosomal beta glucosidase [Chlorella sorokiniana]|uniref:Lysosomal beta glucosidase n=1 Tax=Chlorella sorokiniana TaxID=3076 RepID=A0A2P6TMB4_CHLSO|nr:Lysosomal beta glucosidase [Chlorella sorokiniana]|eukprot:PRW45482.1 Lysosomal beta glucosidase [Chlorella sorokiniana]
MCLLLALALAVAPQFSADPQAAVAVTEGYLHSWSWVGHAAIGGLGAVINAGVLGSAAANFGLLSAAASIFLADVCLGCGLPTLVYMFKTAGGDLLAGKLDQKEWWAAAAGLAILPLLLPTLQALLGAAGAAGAAVATPLAQLYSVAAADGGYGRILLLLFVIQLACELGDARLERWTFFRHRYSFEVATALLLAAVRLYPQELLAVQIDLVACMAYRLAGFAVLAATSPATTRIIFAALFRVYFWQRGTRMVRVRDPQVARAVLAASDSKGEGLESAIACPAWAPVLSLESIDGQLWRETRDDFDALMRQLPPAAKLQEAATARLDALVASGADIDADAIARWSLASFLSYLFGVKEWKPEYECLVQASWEWRKEIAVRGAADSAVKQAAVRLLTEQLLPGSPLWPIYGERWREPRYYSLLMQPFIISPAINLGDIAVALQLAPPGTAPDAAVRDMHPFPIFERYVDKAILHPDTGEVAVPAGSHCIIFSADLAGSQFPIFGAGPRACPGGPLITGLLPLMQSKLVGCPRFHPQRGHESSGRHNDTNWSGAETAYFVKTVGKLLV